MCALPLVRPGYRTGPGVAKIFTNKGDARNCVGHFILVCWGDFALLCPAVAAKNTLNIVDFHSAVFYQRICLERAKDDHRS